jgi:hypothetical protein
MRQFSQFWKEHTKLLLAVITVVNCPAISFKDVRVKNNKFAIFRKNARPTIRATIARQEHHFLEIIGQIP